MTGGRSPLADPAVFESLFAHRLAALIAFPVCFFTIFLAVMLWPHTYAAEATLLVKLGRENIAVPAVSQSPVQVMSVGLRKEDIVTEIEMLRSRQLLQGVIADLGGAVLDPESPRTPGSIGTLKWSLSRALRGLPWLFREVTARLGLSPRLSAEERMADRLGRALAVEQLAQSSMIAVSVRWDDRDVAAKILANLIEGYLELHLAAFRQPGQQDFFGNQAGVLEQRIAAAEDELRRIQSLHQVYAGTSQERVVQERLSAAKQALLSTRADIAELSSQIQDLQRRLESAADGEAIRQYLPDTELEVHRRRLLELDLERAKLQTIYLEDSQIIRNLDTEIAAVKERLREHEADLIRRQIRSFEARLTVLKVREVKQQGQVAADQAEIEAIARYGSELRRLQHQIASDEGNLALYRARGEEARIAEVLHSQRDVNVSVVQPVGASEQPVAPAKMLILGLGFIFSLILAVALAFVLAHFDTSIRRREDVERVLSLPFLGAVRESATTPIAIDVDRVKGNLGHQPGWSAARCLAVVASSPGEGCSWIALHLAQSLARDSGGRVLLLDASFRDPRLHLEIGVPLGHGLADLLGGASTLKERPAARSDLGLEFIPAGSVADQALPADWPVRLRDLLAELAEVHDRIVIDAGSLLSHPDAGLVAAAADAALIVVGGGILPAATVLEGRACLEQAQPNILGAVLNRQRNILPGWLSPRL